MDNLKEMRKEIKAILESNEKICADCYLKFTEEIKQLQAKNAKLSDALDNSMKFRSQLREEVEKIKAENVKFKEENNNLEKLFELQRSRYGKAEKHWHLYHNEPLSSPDLGDLLDFLVERIEELENLLRPLVKYAKVLELTENFAEVLAQQANNDEEAT